MRRALIYLLILTVIFTALPGAAYSQQAIGSLEGMVRDTEGQPVAYATVFVKEILKGTSSSQEGSFSLEAPAGSYTLRVSCQGYLAVEQTISIPKDSALYLEIIMQERAIVMNDAVVISKSAVEKVKEQPFAVASIDARTFHNTNRDINSVLGQVSGIRIREEGGLGSNFDVNLNGLSGRQVKFFIDGVPMENFSNSLSLNNFPANLIDRIEVYKGVVPVKLGADALGGAINVLTKEINQDYLDLSYAFGSFNTHRAAINSQLLNNKSGFVTRLNGFYNYSDNNYRMNVRLPDPRTGQYGEPQDVRRFHDAYRSGMVQLKSGWLHKKYADELLFGVTASANKDEVQHAISLDRIFGEVYTTSQTLMPSLQYKKYDFLTRGLSLKAFSAYGLHRQAIADTSSRQYNWLGEYSLRNNQDIGEFRWQKSLFSFHDRTFISNIGADYALNDWQHFSFNYTQSYLHRTGEDPLSRTKVPFRDPNIIDKKIFGLDYTFELFNKKWVSSIFAKYYRFDALAYHVDFNDRESQVETSFRKPGYGIASTYHFQDRLQLKASFEKTYRLPEGYEMFGDGLLVNSNPYLVPETSYNANLGLRYQTSINDLAIQAESNVFMRDSKDWIRIEAKGIISEYVNVKDVRSSGAEGDLNLKYKQLISLGLNATYQNIINTTQFDKGRISYVYLDRVPNIPYFFANAQAGIHLRNIFLSADGLSLFWRARFIEEYYLKWPSLGDPDNKHVIPAQFIQDFELIYEAAAGKYNISLSSTNIMDAKAYDLFRLQKPGRAFFVKLRYFITHH